MTIDEPNKRLLMAVAYAIAAFASFEYLPWWVSTPLGGYMLIGALGNVLLVLKLAREQVEEKEKA